MKAWVYCALLSYVWAACDLSISVWNESCYFEPPPTYPNCGSSLKCNCSGGYFGVLTSEFFDGAPSNVTAVSFPQGNITAVHDGAFLIFSGMKCIFLDNNQISSIGSNAFPTSAAWQYVFLTLNSLTTFDFAMFSSPDAIVYVYYNKLTFLNISNFVGLAVSAGANEITSIQVVNSSIGQLSLDENPLQALFVKSFSNFNLSEFHCQYCTNLTYLEPGVFSGMSQLSTIDLTGSGLVWIEPGVFVDLPKLSNLYLISSSLRGLGQIINTPALTDLDVSLDTFVSANLLSLCRCSLDSDLGFNYAVVCPPGSNPTSKGCVCERGFICLYTGPMACAPGTFSQAGEYIDATNATCRSCPTGTHLNGAECVFCPAGQRATSSSNCTACANVAECPLGSVRPLSSAQVEELKHPLKLQKASFESVTTPLITDSSLAVIIVFTFLALLAFGLLPWLARKFNLSHETASHVDLMSLAHRVVLGKSLVREATWLGVAMSFAVVCGSVIMTVVLVESNAPVTEYYLKFSDDSINTQNSILFELTPWVNDPLCDHGASLELDTSLLANHDQPTRVQCTENVRWKMSADTRLSFNVPLTAQLVKWQLTATDLRGSPTVQSGIISPPPGSIFADYPVTLAFTVRDASFDDLGAYTQGLQAAYSHVDLNVPISINASLSLLMHWHLDVTLEMLDTALYGRSYRPQTDAQLFASIFSIIISMLAASRALFAYGVEPLVKRFFKDKGSKIPADVDMNSSGNMAELTERIEACSVEFRRCTEALAELRARN